LVRFLKDIFIAFVACSVAGIFMFGIMFLSVLISDYIPLSPMAIIGLITYASIIYSVVRILFNVIENDDADDRDIENK